MNILFSLFFSMMLFSFAILFLIACCIGRMRMFQKAGVEGWKAFIPFYRDYVLCQITMGKGWYFLLGFIPILYPVMKVLYAIEICLCFGQEMLFGVVYFFFPWLCELIIGFGRAEYLGSENLDMQIRNIFASPRTKGPQGGSQSGGPGPATGASFTDSASEENHTDGSGV